MSKRSQLQEGTALRQPATSGWGAQAEIDTHISMSRERSGMETDTVSMPILGRSTREHSDAKNSLVCWMIFAVTV